MGEALRERLSDAGSIPARSIRGEYVLMTDALVLFYLSYQLWIKRKIHH